VTYNATVFGSSRGRYGWAVPILLVAAVVLVAGLAFNLANLDTGEDAIPEVPGPSVPGLSPISLADALPLIWGAALLFLGALVALSIYALVHGRTPSHKRGSSGYLQRLVMLMIVFLGILLLGRQLTGPPSGDTTSGGDGGGPGDGGVIPTDAAGTIAGIPLAVFLVAAFFAGLVVLWFVIRLPPSAASPAPARPRVAPQEPAKEAVVDAIRDLEAGGDIRSAILLCFHRFCGLLGARGIQRQASLTPRELEGLAVEQLHVSPEATADLTSLFEEARYSDHALREEHRYRALTSLERIRAALEGAA